MFESKLLNKRLFLLFRQSDDPNVNCTVAPLALMTHFLRCRRWTHLSTPTEQTC